MKRSPGWDSYDPRRMHWSRDPDDPDGHAGEGRSRTGKIAAKAAKEGKGMNQKGSEDLLKDMIDVDVEGLQ